MSELREALAPIDVFITGELRARPPRAADYLQEKRALQDLARQMIDHPAEVLPHLVDQALEVCGSISGGISLYEAHPAPGVFRWHHLRGRLAPFTGGTTPREFSPCGVCLDLAEPVLTQRPERVYTWLVDAGISVAEVLLVPLFIGGRQPLGTLWVVAEREGHFDSGHARVLTELATFAGIAIHMQRTEQRLLESLAQQEMLTKEMGHRVKNLFMLFEGMVQIGARSAATPKDMATILSGRVRAMAAGHALIRRSFDDSNSVNKTTDLVDLVETILVPHVEAAATPGPRRCRIEGSSVRLGERATNGFALVFHELATNAAKYGALKNGSGGLRVSWHRQESGYLVLTWREDGGPAIGTAPVNTGFGVTLVRQTIAGQFGGTLSYDWRPRGLSVAISIPIENLSA